MWQKYDDWFWMENQGDFENQAYLIPYHLFTGITSRYEFFKNCPSLQKISRILAALGLLGLSGQQLSLIDNKYELLMLLPNISLIVTTISFVFAAYISLIEEELGEDGMEMDSESEENAEKPRFLMETSRDPSFVAPKYSAFQKWKFYTILYQTAFVLQWSVQGVWVYEEV